MTRWLAFLLPLFFATPALAQPLITPAELAARSGARDLRVLDIRDGKTADGKTLYAAGHIPGAQSAPYSKWRGPKENPGRLPAIDALTELLRSLGIDEATRVVVVYAGKDSTDFGAAARVYWTLKAAGVRELTILNGGVKAWSADSRALTTDIPTVARSNFSVTLDPRLIATRDEVAQAVSDDKVRLLDARPAAYFLGEARHPAAKTPGTLVGAKNVDNDVWFASDSAALRPATEIRQIAQQQGIETDQPTVSFCNTGHWAATNWFVLSEVLGQRDVKLYPESMVAWSNAGLPMANVPTRLQQFWLQLKEAAAGL
jgi:thiosulfate/3-mercaptopyruvate sulfurtransferase